MRERDVEDEHGRGLDVGDSRGRLGEGHLAVAAEDLHILVVEETNLHLVLADLGALTPEPQDQVQPRVRGGKLLHPDVLEHPQDGDLPGLVDEGVVGDDGEVEVQRTRMDVTWSFCLMAETTSIPFVTCPNTVWTPSRCACGV